MKLDGKLASSALVLGALALAGCELIVGIKDGRPIGAGGDGGPIIDQDAASDRLCDPLSQSGCPAGDKCSWLVDDGGGRTACVFSGDAELGAACDFVEGFDRCAAGLVCVAGQCRAICDPFEDSCGGEHGACLQQEQLFTDLPYPVGVCGGATALSCDPVFQDCPGGQACYIEIATRQPFCAAVPMQSLNLLQDDVCFGNAEQCFDDGCDKGHAPILLDPETETVRLCAFLCRPANTHTQVPQDAAGIGVTCESTFDGQRPDGPGEGYQCRFVQSFYNNTSDVPAEIGMCVDPSHFGDCRECDISSLQTLAATCGPGCVSLETIMQLPSEPDPGGDGP